MPLFMCTAVLLLTLYIDILIYRQMYTRISSEVQGKDIFTADVNKINIFNIDLGGVLLYFRILRDL